ncbi:MAG TPA: tetratricopeptide repeat protein, partial [Anaerolineae bacterium]|nr:tetratricopeptide repeat protein [Anaerolineae bacterium]
NRFYPPDLAHYEARNASPDRSHNETWDSFVITGALGFVAEQFLFLSVFFFALKFIGWIPSRRAAMAYIGLMILGGVAGALALGATIGVNFMGAGWPGGVVAGMVLYVVLFALFHFQISTRVYLFTAAVLIAIIDAAIFGATFTSSQRALDMLAATGGGMAAFAALYFLSRWAFDEAAGQPIAVSGHVFLIIALFGGMLAHYLEIGLAGIAIAATRTYFWTFAGLLVVTGLNLVPADDPQAAPSQAPRAAAETAPKAPPANVPRHKKKRAASARPAPRAEPRPSIARAAPGWLGPTLAMALIGALILATLGFEFITAPPPSPSLPPVQSVTEMLTRSLTRLPYQDNRPSPGTLLMFAVTWVFGAAIALTELRRREIVKPGHQLRATLVYTGVSLVVAFVYWMLHGSQVLAALRLVPSNQGQGINDFVNQFITLAEAMAGLLSLFYVMVFALIAGIALSLAGESHMRALPQASNLGLFSAVPAALVALALLVATNFNIIRADIIYKQGQPYIANNACDGKAGQCDVAIAHLKQALKYAPREDFYMLSLGASYLNKSAAAPDGPPRFVDNQSFESILKDSPQDTAQLNRRDALTAARVTLESAQQVNPLNTDHSANLARLHRRWSDLAADDAERRLRLDQAGDYYRQATTLSPHNAQLWNEWAVIYFSLWDLASRLSDQAAAATALQEAQAKLDESLRLDDSFVDTYVYLSSLYSAQGRAAEAETALRQAREMSPDNSEVWGRLTEQYLATGNITEAEKLTVDFVSRNPDFLIGWRYLARRIYFPAGRLADAIGAARRAVELGANDPGLWEDQLALAEMLRLAGNLPEALAYAQAALQAAPEDRKASAQTVVDAIQTALNGPAPSP